MIPKFRVWIKTEKRMIETDDLLAIDYENEVVMTQQVYFENGLPDDRDIYCYDFDEIELMRSTGLQDKNGREIFEGDILACKTDDEVINLNIFWDEEHALFMFESKKYNEQEPLAELVEDNTYPFEIIGNIYENPDLLEDK
ncbi:YopX family protein [Streptococcus mitis]|uniref:YopX family protein n=1 Tax=Streptococcus mitis TaxID=28037 RepID=UPI0022B7CB24|nr:YopX family protein [Streptococcus mitis]